MKANFPDTDNIEDWLSKTTYDGTAGLYYESNNYTTGSKTEIELVFKEEGAVNILASVSAACIALSASLLF